MARESDRHLVRLALYDAIEWQRSLADAYRHIDDAPERVDALALVRRYKAVLRKRYGTDRHAGQDRIDNAVMVSLTEIEATPCVPDRRD